jgi:hypothetical protein
LAKPQVGPTPPLSVVAPGSGSSDPPPHAAKVAPTTTAAMRSVSGGRNRVMRIG